MNDDDIDNAFDGEEEAEPSPEIPEETTDLVTVAQARNMKEARAMKSILESAEIAAFIGQEDPVLGQPGGAVGHGIPVLVPEGMAIEAEEILAEAAMSADDARDGGLDEDWDLEEDDEEDDDLDDGLDDLDEDDDYDDDEDDDYEYDDEEDDDF